MADYGSLEEMMNTTENMKKLINNSGQDDNTLSYTGVDWFFFNNKHASTIYVSGNSWIGLGANAEQLLVCRRDTKLWNLYWEEATLFGCYRVLKIRWEGYGQYNNTTADMALQYEWFFFETGDMFLNLIHPPVNSSYLGSSRVNGGTNQAFTVEAGKPQLVSFYHADEVGILFDIQYGILDIRPPYDRKYLLSDKSGTYYRTVHEKAFVDAIEFKGYQLIRTGIIPNQDTRVEVALNTSVFNDAALVGSRKSTSADKFGIFLSSATQMHGQFGTQSITEAVDDYTGVDVMVEVSKDGLKRDGGVIAEFEEAEFEAPVEMTVGTINTDGVLETRYFAGKIYSVTIWQGEDEVLHLIPCVDEEVQPCFYDTVSETCFYNAGYGKFGFEDTEGAYDRATYLEEVEVSELNAEVFREHGFIDFPRSEVLTRLVNPSLLYWQDSEDELPEIAVDIKAVPPVQIVFSKNTEMIDSTILGIEKVEIEADDSTLFAFSFDAGATWKAYIENQWVTLSEATSGMNRETVEAIGTDAWTIANETNQYMVRFTLLEGGYVNRIIIHYLN